VSAGDYQSHVINGAACPVCKAKAGKPCKMTNGRPYQIGGERIPHHERYRVFNEGRDIIERQSHERGNR
jgi:hypothetical protein